MLNKSYHKSLDILAMDYSSLKRFRDLSYPFLHIFIKKKNDASNISTLPSISFISRKGKKIPPKWNLIIEKNKNFCFSPWNTSHRVCRNILTAERCLLTVRLCRTQQIGTYARTLSILLRANQWKFSYIFLSPFSLIPISPPLGISVHLSSRLRTVCSFFFLFHQRKFFFCCQNVFYSELNSFNSFPILGSVFCCETAKANVLKNYSCSWLK